MEVKYSVPGEEGRQCKDCKNFVPAKSSGKGECMGYPVQAEAGCNLFESLPEASKQDKGK